MKRALACNACRQKKVKCETNDGKYPCVRCTRTRTPCSRPGTDLRSSRMSVEKLTQLENELRYYKKQAQEYEQLKSQFPKLSSSSTHNLKCEFDKDDSSLYDNKVVHPAKYETSELPPEPVHTVYGPTSFLGSATVQKQHNDDTESVAALSEDVVVLKCVKLFFRWLYPDIHSFMYREAFLDEFLTRRQSLAYCSKELVYAVCAVGSTLSNDQEIKSRSEVYYKMAKSGLLDQLDAPSIPALQGFLLLGLYDIYCDRDNAGWMLSGNAMRMGFSIGIQLDPKSWFKGKGDREELNTSIRSRVFWGCYVADHFLSLLFGRPSVLKKNDTTIRPPERMPDLPDIGDYTFKPQHYSGEEIPPLDISTPLKAMTELCSLQDDIINDMFGSKKFNLQEKVRLLDQYNAVMSNWRTNLPERLQWTLDSLSERATDPTKMTHIYFYFMLLICLNRPFLETRSASSELCFQAVESVRVSVSRFCEVWSYSKCSLLMVYSCIISVSVILLSIGKSNGQEFLAAHPKINEQLYSLLDVLKNCSKTWKLSESSFQRIRRTLKEHGVNIDEGLQHSNSFTFSTTPEMDPEQNFENFFGGPPLLFGQTCESWDFLGQTLFDIGYQN